MQHRLLTKGLALAAGLLLAATTITPATAGPTTINRGSYAALGDSYAAGVGNETLLPGAAKSGRTAEAYPVLLAGQWNRVAFLASSGATTEQVLMNQVPKVPESVDQITLTVGGNDVGFISVAQTCAGAPDYCEAAIEVARSALPGVAGNLSALIGALRAQAPKATIFVTGYPQVFQPMEVATDMYYCPALELEGMPEIDPGLLHEADLAVAGLNAVIRGVAMASGAVYVDVEVPEGICTAPDGYIFATTLDGGVPLHPTAFGQQVYADAIAGADFVTG